MKTRQDGPSRPNTFLEQGLVLALNSVMVAVLATPHIWLDEMGRAWIDETNVKVIEIAANHVCWGWSAESMQEQFPGFTLAQIHAALAYYYDHQAEFDRQMEVENCEEIALASVPADSSLQMRLRQLKRAQ